MIRNLLLSIALSGAWSAAAADMVINLEEAAEVTDLRITTDSASTGHLFGRICDYCETIKLDIDAKTTIQRQRRQLTLREAAALRGQGATVLFDPATRKVTRILYWF